MKNRDRGIDRCKAIHNDEISPLEPNAHAALSSYGSLTKQVELIDIQTCGCYVSDAGDTIILFYWLSFAPYLN